MTEIRVASVGEVVVSVPSLDVVVLPVPTFPANASVVVEAIAADVAMEQEENGTLCVVETSPMMADTIMELASKSESGIAVEKEEDAGLPAESQTSAMIVDDAACEKEAVLGSLPQEAPSSDLSEEVPRDAEAVTPVDQTHSTQLTSKYAESEHLSPVSGANMQDANGKWAVDTSYIDWRTADPNRRESRRSAAEREECLSQRIGVVGVSKQSADSAGKWTTVDVGYINHRTSDCDNLEARRNVGVLLGASQTASATVEKTRDGKWKVDTSYVQHRTADVNNLDKKLESASNPEYSDPMTTKLDYSLIRASNRPGIVDPARKEQYLSDEEFLSVFGIPCVKFTQLPKWKQNNMKKAKELF